MPKALRGGPVTQVSIPNGMTTVYGYDTRNRLTTIEHKDGSTVLDGWTYSLDDQGNITRTDQADGSYWTYGYDGRYRLTTADRYEASGSTIRAQYAYGYDLADNLTAKTEPFLDDFEDGNYTGWSSGGGWSATTKVLKENYATATRITRNNGQNDVDLRFRYMTTDTTAGLFGEMCFRTSSTNALTNNTVLRMSTDGMTLQKVYLGATTVLDSEPSATAAANTWYRVRILAKGSNVTVWRGEGDDGPMEEVLSTTVAPTLTPASMWFISGANAAFAYDDVAIVANDWTSDTTFATNSGNELTSSTFGGVPVLTGVHTLRASKYSNATTTDAAIDATPQDGATPDNQFRLNRDGTWRFNWSTKGLPLGTRKLITALSDGSEHSVWIALKKRHRVYGNRAFGVGLPSARPSLVFRTSCPSKKVTMAMVEPHLRRGHCRSPRCNLCDLPVSILSSTALRRGSGHPRLRRNTKHAKWAGRRVDRPYCRSFAWPRGIWQGASSIRLGWRSTESFINPNLVVLSLA